MAITVDPEKIKELVQIIFERSGLNPYEAEIVSDNLVQAELRGIRSHGLVQVKNYSKLIKEGNINSSAQIKTLKEGPSTLVLDADHAPGSVSGTFAMKKTIEKAKESGVAITTVKNGTHFGFAAYYAQQALGENMIGLSFTSTGKAVAPFGGFEKMIGTNPICVAIPSENGKSVIFDAATSNVAFNKIFFAYTEGRTIPDDWALDINGNKTTNPKDIIEDGGALLPFGEYKGYGLGFIVFILTTLLSGTSVLDDTDETAVENYRQVAYNFAAIDISRFTDVENFKKNLAVSVERLKASKKLPGNAEIFVPGEIEANNYEKGIKEGLVLYDGVSNALKETLEDLKINKTLESCAI